MKSFIADKNKKISKLIPEKVDGLSYSAVMKLLREKDIKVNGKRVKEDVTLSVGDAVEIYCKDVKVERYSEIYKDENVYVINKKSGYTSEDVFEDVKSKYESAKFIHRLDRNTSGIMIFALNETAENELLFGFKERTFIKTYKAFVFGKMPKKNDILSAYLLKDSDNSQVKIFANQVKGSVPIKTGYEVLSYTDGVSELSVRLYTGKTHQIRAHLAFLGNPIVGDGKYGDNKKNRERGAKSQMLYAYKLQLKFDKISPLFYLDGKEFINEEV